MESFTLHILGCGSARPTLRHKPSAQLLNIHEKIFMIDCGEGTQLQMARARINFNRLNHIFISHLHGDHCFGLPGLISTFDLLGRTAPLFIHSPGKLEEMLRPILDFHFQQTGYEVIFQPFSTHEPAVIYEDRTVSVTTVPLKHRVPCCGFVFREQPSLPHIRRDMMDFYQIPICERGNIKAGHDWMTPEGILIPNSRLVRPAEPARSYAYYSDTAYVPGNAEYIKGIDLLYHESTYGAEYTQRAEMTMHSTSEQAANMAKAAGVKRLIIGHYSSRYDDETPLLDECRKIFPDTLLAKEGLTVDIR